jgi:eukaryotic-like serine/threonine-protein kinase
MVGELQPADPRAIGPYRLVGRLGEGGMGQVFLGVSPGGRPVAVKAIRAELAADPQFRARFGREVAAARRVGGVYTAMVVDADVDGPVPWLATVYVAGPSLAEAVDGDGPLPEVALLALAAGLAESLSAIHAAGVVHRDLKPSNVLLAEDGPRVIDFGISQAAESSALTQTGVVVGSPRFISPEQAVGGEVGPPSDIFSLGAVLAFAATGNGPFGSGITPSLLYRVVHETPDLDGVPAAVRPLIERCLAKDPAQRPTAAGVLAAVGDLQSAGDWLPDSIIHAFPESAPPDPAPATGPSAATALDLQFFPAVGSPPPAPDPHAVTGVDAQRVPIAALLSVEGQQPPPGDDGRPRRRLWSPLVLALGIGGLVAVFAATFALTAATGHSSAPPRSTPAAQVSAAPATSDPATGGSTSPAVTHRASASASASSPATVSPTTPMSPMPTTMGSSMPASMTPTVRPSSPAPSSTSPSSSAASSPPPSSPPPSTAPPTSPPPTTSSPSPSTSGSATPTETPSASASLSRWAAGDLDPADLQAAHHLCEALPADAGALETVIVDDIVQHG